MEVRQRLALSSRRGGITIKRGTPTHPKTKTLAAFLDLPVWGAVGLLESLWHFTATYAKRGDIGRWTNRDIAAGIDWKGNPDELIEALLTSRWLDKCKQYRLLVHDWSDHADQGVERSEEVKSLGFAMLVLDDSSDSLESSAKTVERQAICKAKAKATAEGKLVKDETPQRNKIPPKVEWVRTYCLERKNEVDPELFMDHYIARAWKYKDGQSMKDWEAAVRTWEKNNFHPKESKGLLDIKHDGLPVWQDGKIIG